MSRVRVTPARPSLIEILDQSLEGIGFQRGVEPRHVGELIDRVMHAGIRRAPEPPAFLRFEIGQRHRQVMARIPLIEFLAQWLNHHRTHHEIRLGHRAFLLLLASDLNQTTNLPRCTAAHGSEHEPSPSDDLSTADACVPLPRNWLRPSSRTKPRPRLEFRKIFAYRLRRRLDVKIERHALSRRALRRTEIFGRCRENFLPRLPLRGVRHCGKRAFETGSVIARAGALTAAAPVRASPPQFEDGAIAPPL